MEEKEERILHIVQKLDGRFVGENRISAKEAIERMAKAIYTFEIVACSHDECGNKQCENCETWKWCENIAEAALNSLLEEQK